MVELLRERAFSHGLYDSHLKPEMAVVMIDLATAKTPVLDHWFT